MVAYLLDTNIVSFWYDDHRAEHANVVGHVEAARQPDPKGYIPRLFISVVALGEIEFGHKVAPTPDHQAQAQYLEFVRNEVPETLEITAHVSESYGALKAWLFENFRDPKKTRKRLRLEQLVSPIAARELGADENDLWITAQAMYHELVLVTHDSHGHFGEMLQHFAKKLRIRVEDWAQP